MGEPLLVVVAGFKGFHGGDNLFICGQEGIFKRLFQLRFVAAGCLFVQLQSVNIRIHGVEHRAVFPRGGHPLAVLDDTVQIGHQQALFLLLPGVVQQAVHIRLDIADHRD